MTIGGGYFADRRGRWKDVATAGYGLSAISKGGSWSSAARSPRLGAIVVMDRDRQGHPHGAARRDDHPDHAQENLGAAFGMHRALDTTGAMIGPLLAFAILAVAPFALRRRLDGLALLRDPRRRRARAVRAQRRGRRGRSRREPALVARAPRPAAPAPASAASSSSPAVPGAGDHQRRVRLPGAAAGARTSTPRLPAPVHGHRAGLHAPRHARWAGSPTASGASRVFLGRLRDAARASTAAPARRRAAAMSALVLVAARRVLRRDRRRARRDRPARWLPERGAGHAASACSAASRASRGSPAPSVFGALWTAAGVEAAVRVFTVALVVGLARGAAVLRSSDPLPAGA